MAVFGLQTYTFRDAKGMTSTMRFQLTGADAAGLTANGTALLALLHACTNAATQGFHGAYSNWGTLLAYGSASNYQNIEDKAVLLFQDNSANYHRVQIPAPKAAIFLADLETVNPAQTDVAALVTALLSYMVTPNINAVMSSFIGGQYIRRRNKRRYNLITKNPSLNGPGL